MTIISGTTAVNGYENIALIAKVFKNMIKVVFKIDVKTFKYLPY
jgi:hypothetical protein